MALRIIIRIFALLIIESSITLALGQPMLPLFMQNELLAGFISPTNLMGIVANFDQTYMAPLATTAYPANTFTDLVGGVILQATPANSVTNFGIGLYTTDYNAGCMTNPSIVLANSFTLEVVFRLCPEYQPTNLATNSGANFLSTVIDGQIHQLYGTTNGDGLCISNGTIVANWGSTLNVSSASFATTNWLRPTYDIVDSGGTLYTNGIVCGAGVGQPAGSFNFQSMGCSNKNNNAIGYFQAIRLWNRPLALSEVVSVYNYNLTNGATDYTNGLQCRIKMDATSGTAASDDYGNFNGTLLNDGKGYPVWTNGFLFANNNSNNGALYFNSNMVVLANSNPLWNNYTNATLCLWYKTKGLNIISSDNWELWNQASGDYNDTPFQGSACWFEYYNIAQDLTFYLSEDNADYIECAFADPADGSWHFVCDEVTTNYPKVWVDGEQVNAINYACYASGGTVTTWKSTAATNLFLLNGDRAYPDTDFYTTNLTYDDFQIFTNTLLTPYQMKLKLQKGPQ